ncbi:MAG: HEAT repeat domain-containing protein [Myxococcales bacterium]
MVPRRNFLLVAVLLACGSLFSGVAAADARTDFLIRMLGTSAQFRVRTQAALALGGQQQAAAVTQALSKALSDEHPAVRAASAASLGRLKDPTAISALKVAQNDRDSSVRAAVRGALDSLGAVASAAASSGATKSTSGSSSSSTSYAPSGPATYYVGVGVPGSQVGLSQPALHALREHVVKEVTQMQGVRLAPENEDQKAAQKVIGSAKLVGYFVDSSVTKVEARPDGSVRAQVSVVIGTYPGRDIRAMLSGAATVSGGGTTEAAKVQAVQAAFTGALRRLPQAMQAGLARAE